ncbi:MAG: sensor histidine kinase [Desulfococcaceae bacterium]
MKHLHLSIVAKIWLVIAFLVIVYAFSMIGVYAGGNLIKQEIFRISSISFPASGLSYEALIAFRNQIGYYEDAVEEGENRFIRKAEKESATVVQSLKEIIRTGNPDQSRIRLAREILKTVEIYISGANHFCSEMAAQESAIVSGDMADCSTHLAFHKDRILSQLTELHQVISADLRYEIESLTRSLNRQQIIHFCIFATVLPVSLFAMWFVIRRSIAVPVQELLTNIRKISEGGLSVFRYSDHESKDEIGHLRCAFDEMLSELTNSHQLMSRYAEQLERDIDKYRSAQDRLEEAYADLRTMQLQLVQSGKLASIGELAAGVAHELNQPLMVIRAASQLLPKGIKEKILTEEQIAEQLKTVERNTGRMMRIIKHLRDFSRQSSHEFKYVNISSVLEDCFLMIGEQLRLHSIRVEKNYAPDLPLCYGNANRLEQVFLNLLTNARDAVSAKADIVPEFRASGGLIEIVTRVSEEKTVEIIVKDNGCGIEREFRDRIFDPFFTTREVGKGTGLGLSISYGIIREHQGSLDIMDTSFQGTAMRIRLPAAGQIPDPDFRMKSFDVSGDTDI